MDDNNPLSNSYWSLLQAAESSLDRGDFATAEQHLDAATAQRDSSPGRVFFSEKLGDAFVRLVGRRPSGAAGRWERRRASFAARFREAGETCVRTGLRLAELRPEDNAEANQPVLAGALFLVCRSRLFPEEPPSAVILLKGLLRTAHRTGRPFAPHLLRPDLPLTEEDRLWLARKGGAMLEVFVEQHALQPGTAPAQEWASAVLQFLDPRYFAGGDRLEEERCWLEAVSSDRLLGRADASVVLYRSYLERQPRPGPRADEARVRLMEILGNIDARHYPVPHYGDALGALQSAGLAPGSEVAGRYQAAVARWEHRRPEGGGSGTGGAWATVAGDREGLAVVVWWGHEPRDVGWWRPGQDAEALADFLAPCGERVIASDGASLAAAGGAWPSVLAPWTVNDFVGLIAEPILPREGLTTAALARLAEGETGPWRAGWREDLGHPDLAPSVESPAGGDGVAVALRAGLAWLALRRVAAEDDPALRAGIGCLAKRGDPAATILYEHLVLDDPAGRAIDEVFAPWTLPLLWTRPDAFAGLATAGAAGAESVAPVRPDLGRNSLVIVTTGRPGPVLAAWGEGRHRWRVVLDRPERLEDVARAAPAAAGPATVVPAGGRVHDLALALGLLEDLLPGGAQSRAGDGLLALCHWQRLAGTHNGDLMDVATLRSWEPGAFPILERYGHLVADLPRREPSLDEDDGSPDWSVQFSQRVRRAGCVVGLAADLPGDITALDATWGVFEGSGASWVFLDSAVVHRDLTARTGEAAEAWHARLQGRGDRHLSVLTGAVWARAEVETLLARGLAIFGTASTLALTDLQPPLLLLADRGVAPTARRGAPGGLAAALAHVGRQGDGQVSRLVLLPQTGVIADFWREEATRLLGPDAPCRVLAPDEGAGGGGPGQVLVLPELASLASLTSELPEPSPAGWAERDEGRRAELAVRRSACSLELAAHLAGRWDAVEVLDIRWWTLLAAAPALGHRTGDAALVELAPSGARCFDLPGANPGAAPAPSSSRVAAIRSWLDRRPDWEGVAEISEVDRPGRHLEIGAGDATREALLAAMEVAWESGATSSWLLCVADAAWAAGATAAGALANGQSVWTPETTIFDPGPVVWVRPDQLLTAGLVEAIGSRPPAAILVPEVAEWLPGAAGDARTSAVALRTLLDLPARRVVLQAETLPESWVRYLVAAVDVKVVESHLPPVDEAGQKVTAPPGTPPRRVVARLQRLLAGLRPLLEERRRQGEDPERLVSARELVDHGRLGVLAGLPPAVVAHGLAVLRWTASLAGDNLSSAAAGGMESEDAGGGYALLISRRFAELEMELEALADTLELLLPLWIGALPEGGRTWIDLAAPPAEIDAERLRRLDTFLLATPVAETGLDYQAPDGVLGANLRRLDLHRPPREAGVALGEALSLFGGRLREVMSTATETADGFLVETGLAHLRLEEEAFLGLGAALGDWRWLGPGGGAASHLVDLLTLAESPTAGGDGAAWRLTGELLGVREAADRPARAERSDRGGRWWSVLGGDRDRDDVAAAVARVAEVAGGEGDTSFLVLRGTAGSGRCEAVLTGLDRAGRLAADPRRPVVYCPDTASAARWRRRALGLGMDLDLRLPGADATPPSAPATGWSGPAAGDVVVLVEAERFGSEMRYRVAQAGRGRRLIMTTDPEATAESWENLFLTTPRAADVLALGGQHEQARRLWSEVRQLLDEDAAVGSHASRSEKGRVEAEYAANLDQCLARIIRARAEALLPDLFRITAPLTEDVEFLGQALRDQGWLAVDEEDFDGLFLPGPCELLAAAADLLAENGELGRAVGGPVVAEAEDEEVPVYAPLLPRLTAGIAATDDWLGAGPHDPDTLTLGALHRALTARPDLAPTYGWPAARHRAEALVGTWGGRTLTELLHDPLWLSWWHVLNGDLDLDTPAHGRPIVLLGAAGRTPGPMVPGAVHLCLGTEARRDHYRVLSRVGDRLLVLFQERSPLPGLTTS